MSAAHLSAAFTRAVQLRHLRCFVVIAQERHLARAATRLSISQPAVSKTLGELEALAQSQLIRRTTEGRRGILGLTEAGERLLSHSIAVLDAVGAGAASLTDSLPGAAETLRIGVLSCLTAGALPKCLSRLVDERPSLHVAVDTGANLPLMEQLRAGALDVVLGRMSDPKLMTGLSFELLHIETLACTVRRDHPLAADRPSLQAILEQTVILHPPGTVPRHRADTLVAARSLKPPARMVETSDLTLARGMALQSDAVWIAPRYAVLEDLRQGVLVDLKVDAAGTEEPVGLFRNVGKAAVPAAEQLALLLRAEFGALKTH
jgi:LysR family pca operon transcriptional activator